MRSTDFCIILLIGYAIFQDSKAEMNKLAHCCANCSHLSFTLGHEPVIEHLDMGVVFGGNRMVRFGGVKNFLGWVEVAICSSRQDAHPNLVDECYILSDARNLAP